MAHMTPANPLTVSELEDLVADFVSALCADDSEVKTSLVSREDCLFLDIVAPPAQLAMIVGKGRETIAALHRLVLCAARNAGIASEVEISWRNPE